MNDQARISIDQDGLSRCVRGELVYQPDNSQAPFPLPQRLAAAGLRSLVAAPLLIEGKVFGVLVAARRQIDGFSSGECEFLRQLSEHVALAAHQARLYGALEQAYHDLRQSQHTVMQQERLRVLGQMASGIAHDINNAISPVALYTESLLERETGLSDRARDYLITIQRAIDDVAQTVSRMREFYRRGEPQLALTTIDLNRLARQVIDLTRVRWSNVPQERGTVINLQAELASDLPSLPGAEGEIRDALTNLIFNAVDAMPEGGTLTVRTRVGASEARQDGRESATLVHLEVCDTGTGMDEETKRHCLEPFFTTKGERGTGLGLAMVYGMVQRHGAEIEIESEPGKGSTVRISFPAPVALVSPSIRPARPVRPEQRLRILIVDDDPLILKSLRDTLEFDGHLVSAADGGQAGIDTFAKAQSRGEPFAVVITDLGMPYVDGRKVAASIKSVAPSTPVILLTGWGQRLVAENDVPPDVDRVLNKPPRLHLLRSALAELTATAAHEGKTTDEHTTS
jgi:signal transduction histidine kinase/ActR/RegA family two-component response regulator